MKKLRLNIDNEGYYSEAFIKGWKTGVEAQFKADVREQRPRGEWMLECDAEGYGDNLYRCSECGQKYGCQEYDLANFCPECGADMRGKKHDI